jgi:hypothetical protein
MVMVELHFGQVAVTLNLTGVERPNALVAVPVMVAVLSFSDEELQAGASQKISLVVAVLAGVPRFPASACHEKLSALLCGSRAVS